MKATPQDSADVLELRHIANSVVDCEVCRINRSTDIWQVFINGQPFEQYKICDYPGCIGAIKELVA